MISLSLLNLFYFIEQLKDLPRRIFNYLAKLVMNITFILSMIFFGYQSFIYFDFVITNTYSFTVWIMYIGCTGGYLFSWYHLMFTKYEGIK